MEKIKVIELFAGIGSQTKALKRLGIEHNVVAICEWDKYANKSYESTHGKVHNYGDITKVKKLPYCDLLTYSFPCQDISVAGDMKGFKKGSGTRSGLLWEVERLLSNMSEKPKYLLLENVKNLVGEQNKQDFDEWLMQLDRLGYVSYWDILNAKDYGVPQNRERVFAISIRKDINQKRKPFAIGFYDNNTYVFPKKIPLKFTIKDIADFETEVPRKIVKSMYEKTGAFGERFKTQSTISPCVIAKSAYAAITNNYYTRDFKEYTINEIYENDIPLYANSTRMALLLMGFDEDDCKKIELVNSKAQIYKQAGNSIVVDVLVAIFRELFKED